MKTSILTHSVCAVLGALTFALAFSSITRSTVEAPRRSTKEDAVVNRLASSSSLEAPERSDFAGGVANARRIPVLRERLRALNFHFARLARVDARSAIESAQEELTSGELSAVLPELLKEFAKQEPLLAIHWYLDNEGNSAFAGGRHSDARYRLLEEAFSQVAASEPEAALKLAQRIGDDGTRLSVLMPIATSAFLEGRQIDLLETAKGLDSVSRLFVSSATMAQWAEFDLQAAKEAYGKYFSPGEQADQASSIGVAWMQESPQEGADWWLSTASNKDEAITEIIDTWAGIEPTGVAAWAASLPDAESRDTARNSLANRLLGSDPEKALALASSIENAERRGEVWRFQVALLQARNPELAERMINSAQPELKESMATPESE